MSTHGDSVAHSTNQIAAENVRAGHRLMVDGYVREVVRVEPDALVTASQLESVSPAAEEAGQGPSRLRISFLNGGSLIAPGRHVFGICAVQPSDLRPAGRQRVSEMALGMPAGGPAGAEGRSR